MTTTASIAFAPPARPHIGRSRPARALRRRRGLRALQRFPLVAATFLSKFSLPPFGGMGLTIAIPAVFAAAVGGFLGGSMMLDLRRALAFALMLALMLALQIGVADGFSVGSLALLLVIYLPYVFKPRRPERPRDDPTPFFQRMALLIGILGIAQYVLQFVLGPALAFPVENLVPRQLTLSAFNSDAILHYGSTERRANGVFMIEPSIFSQLMAVALVIEAIGRRRLAWLGVYAAAILVSYSGTGVMVLLACLLFEGVARQQWGLLIGAALAVAVVMGVGIALDVPMVTNIIGRSQEFSSAGSSGSARFVGGFALFEKLLWPDPLRALFGYGAGSLMFYAGQSPVPLAEMMLFKSVFEYGLVGAAAFFGFVGWCVFTAPAPPVVRFAVFVVIMLGGMYTPFGHHLACGLLLWRRPGARDA